MGNCFISGTPSLLQINHQIIFMKAADILLTPREKQVLFLLSKGFTYKKISEPLKVSPETIKKHLKNIYKKLKAKNKIEALIKVKLL